MKWQYFEKLVAFVFEKNDFSVRQNVVMKFPEGKRQFDVIAERFDVLFLVECKKWSKHNAAIKKAVNEHLERCRLFIKNEKKSESRVEEEYMIAYGQYLQSELEK